MKVAAALLFFFTASGLFSQTGLAEVLKGVPPGKSVVLSRPQIDGLLRLAARNSWNVFDLIDEVGLYLKTAGKRAVLAGDDLRAAAKPFSWGGRRVDTLFPLALVDTVALGARLGAEADVEIRLSRTFSAFLELGDFDLQTAYGFRELGDHTLDAAYGITVRNGLLRWTLEKVERVPDPTGKGSPNFIAIHLNNFFRPKRWKIEPITLKPPTKP